MNRNAPWYRLLDRTWKFIWAIGKKLERARKESDRVRYCACCSGLARFGFTTVACEWATASETPEPMFIYVCDKHHPNPKRGAKAGETEKYLTSIHPNITYNCIFLHIPL